MASLGTQAVLPSRKIRRTGEEAGDRLGGQGLIPPAPPRPCGGDHRPVPRKGSPHQCSPGGTVIQSESAGHCLGVPSEEHPRCLPEIGGSHPGREQRRQTGPESALRQAERLSARIQARGSSHSEAVA